MITNDNQTILNISYGTYLGCYLATIELKLHSTTLVSRWYSGAAKCFTGPPEDIENSYDIALVSSSAQSPGRNYAGNVTGELFSDHIRLPVLFLYRYVPIRSASACMAHGTPLYRELNGIVMNYLCFSVFIRGQRLPSKQLNQYANTFL